MRTTQWSTMPSGTRAAAQSRCPHCTRTDQLAARLRLTNLDRQILTEVLAGETDEAIATRLDTSARTVRRRMARLSHLLSARSRVSLAAIVVQLGIMQIDVSALLDQIGW